MLAIHPPPGCLSVFQISDDLAPGGFGLPLSLILTTVSSGSLAFVLFGPCALPFYLISFLKCRADNHLSFVPRDMSQVS